MYLLIGKVHGSLARAGKVRGQTPKVLVCIIRYCVMLIFFSCRLKPKKRRKRKLVVLKEGCNIIGDL